MKIKHLYCEYHTNPLGMDILHPRLSWEFDSDRRGAYQRAFRILAAGNAESFERGTPLLWDSGRVEADDSTQIQYTGPNLQSRQRVFWRVCTWDEQDNPGEWSPIAWFEMGLLQPEDWLAAWIQSDLVGDSKTPAPCPIFYKPFSLNRPISAARLYITALGLYEGFINNNRVGEDVFTPGWTDYNERVQYQTYDVTHLLNPGTNSISIILGDGWYCGHVGWLSRQNYGDRPRSLAQLEIQYRDGNSQTIVTDETWLTSPSPILASDMIMGEDYDARLELEYFSSASSLDDVGSSGVKWSPVTIFSTPPGLEIVAQNAPTVRVKDQLSPDKEPVLVKGETGQGWIFDFGQNLVGRVQLRITGERGQKIIMKFGEMLTEGGQLYTENLRTARQTDTYILKGDPGGEIYESHFTFHGFRYVQVEGLIDKPTQSLLTAVVLHSNNSPALQFHCSHALVNQLQHNIEWGWKGNSLDIPSDCPQRDERLGWTGDAQVFVKTATYLTKSASFFSKWVQDLADAQFDYGAIPPFAPFFTDTHRGDGGPAWSDAFIIVPWTIWQQYGDTRILEIHYDAMCDYMDYLVTNSPGMIRLLPDEKELGPGKEEMIGGYGDWLAKDGSEDRRGRTPRNLIGTAFLAYDASLMAQIASVLNRPVDAEKFSNIYKETRHAFQKHFIGPDGLIAGKTQTGYILALHFDLVPKQLKAVTFAALVKEVEARDRHLSTGFVGTPYLCQVLCDGGRLDLAYALLLQRTYPSWLYSVRHGATTIWERWDGWTKEGGFQDPRMNSFNHYAYGAIGAWIVETIAGIRPKPKYPGYKHFHLQPEFPIFSLEKGEDRITWANAEYQSPYGLIKSHWQMGEGCIDWQVVIPPNTTATVLIPDHVRSPVLVDNIPLADAKGITLLKLERSGLLLGLQSGSYNFHIDIMSRRGN